MKPTPIRRHKFYRKQSKFICAAKKDDLRMHRKFWQIDLEYLRFAKSKRTTWGYYNLNRTKPEHLITFQYS